MATPFTISRSTTISASPEAVQAFIRDFHEWPQWSPWEGLDPQLKRTYSGAEAGPGAHYAWSGNRKAGQGAMELTTEEPGRVEVALRFDKPFPSSSHVTFVLSPTESGTTATWRLDGELSGVAALFAKFKSMDSLLGPDLEKGLAQLRAAAERG